MGGMGQDMVISLDSLTGTTFIRRFTCARGVRLRVWNRVRWLLSVI